MTNGPIFGISLILVFLIGPLMLWLSGWFKLVHGEPYVDRNDQWDWKLTIISALLYVLAFNLTFVVQEFFLVLPKALTPGLRPTLFHNNHSWNGESPLASLFQGTGALATLLTGVVYALLLRRGVGRSATARLFLFWMAYSGVFMALPQVVIGALSAQSDLGMAMAFFGLGTTSKTVAGFIALVFIPLVAIRLGSLLIDQLAGPRQATSARERNRFVFRSATLPALLALPAIILYRIPREWIEVLLVPLIVTMAGLIWIQAGACRAKAKPGREDVAVGSIAWPLGAVSCLLLIFQVFLRPGVRFY